MKASASAGPGCARGRLLFGFLEGEDQAVEAHGEADAGGFGAADHFGEAVVASAAEEGVLRAEVAVGELEGGAGVVVEAADEAGIDCVGHAAGVQCGKNSREVGFRGVVEVVGDAGQRLDDGLVFGNFAVEHAERIGFGAALAVGAHFWSDVAQGLAQGGDVARAVG